VQKNIKKENIRIQGNTKKRTSLIALNIQKDIETIIQKKESSQLGADCDTKRINNKATMSCLW